MSITGNQEDPSEEQVIEMQRQRIADLLKQLSERDAALARCVEAARNAVLESEDLTPLEYIADDVKAAIESALTTSAQATAKVLAAARALDTVEDESQDFWDAMRNLYEALREEKEGK